LRRLTFAFRNHVARERRVAASTQNQALSALLFLYREALTAPPPAGMRRGAVKRDEDAATVEAVRRGAQPPLPQ
jgi:hypothetical protein